MRSRMKWLLPLFLAAGAEASALAAPLSLDGDWYFLADPGRTLSVEQFSSAAGARPTSVPSSWQQQFADLRDYAGVGWYWRAVVLKAAGPHEVVLLRFGAVDYRAVVYVNGKEAGEHEGGYLPFEFDVSALVRPGENQIAVRVADPGPEQPVDGISNAEIPHGKQNWYVETSGLWQSAELDYRPRLRLGAARISATSRGDFTIVVPVIRAGTAESAGLSAQILDPAGRTAWQSERELAGGEERAQLSGRLDAPQLWSPSAPNLYTLRLTLSSGDQGEYRFGFRSFTARAGKFYLNGQPLYLRGALDQDFFPDTIYTPPSREALRDEMRQAKALGLNLLRCHIKVPDPRYLDAADEVGVIIWYEIPNWDKLTSDAGRRALETLAGMAERDWNHPSIAIVSIINESWGVDLKEAGGRAWLLGAYQRARGSTPWLVVDNSPCCENFHLATDIADFHQYAAIPDYAANFDRLVDDQAQRPGWLFSPYGDAQARGDEPLVLSEFGNWGLPRPPEDKPWWWSRGFGRGKMPLPEGLEKRFSDYRYPFLFRDLDTLCEATQWHEFEALKYEISALRARAAFQGYVITEFTDVNWEANGLLDMWRRPKAFAPALAPLQRDDVLLLRADRRNYLAAEPVEVEVLVSHYGTGSFGGGTISWQVEGTALAGTLPLGAVAPAEVTKAGTIRFRAPAVSAPAKRRLQASLVVNGKPVLDYSLDFYFYPDRQPELPPAVDFHDPAGRLRRFVEEMRQRNYPAPSGSEALPVLITSAWDDTVKNRLHAGGRVLLIASDAMTLAPGIQIVARAGSDLSGNWISNFLWVRPGQAPFEAIGFGALGGFETQAVTPATVIQGIPAQNFDDVLAGMFYGWLQANSAVLVEAKAGSGKLLICTFSLAGTYNSDPYATYLLDELVNYAVSDFSPRLELP